MLLGLSMMDMVGAMNAQPDRRWRTILIVSLIVIPALESACGSGDRTPDALDIVTGSDRWSPYDGQRDRFLPDIADSREDQTSNDGGSDGGLLDSLTSTETSDLQSLELAEASTPLFCTCPESLPVCLPGGDGGYACTLSCDPFNGDADFWCSGFLGIGACCGEGWDADGVKGDYCLPVLQCCIPCGDECCFADSTCEGAGGDEACVPVGAAYCGGGISCNPGTVCVPGGCCPVNADVPCGPTCCPTGWECVEPGLCLQPGGTDCGEGVVCPPGSQCIEQFGEILCIPNGFVPCDGVHWCAPGQVCAGTGCCPQGLPVPCGSLCCDEGEVCVEEEELCIPEDAEYCGDGVVCPAGFWCASDGGGCIPDTSEYCGGGLWCQPGEVCAGDGCCPQGLPQKCGDLCCFTQYECINDGEACIPAGADYCGNGSWCPPGQLCAEGGAICYPVGGEYCGDGHWCDPGLYCTGPTCCAWDAAPSCGDLCCPATWNCIEGGEACIPLGADYCGDGDWCNAGTVCKADGGCMTLGATECGDELVCSPGLVCVALTTGFACCPEGNSLGCGETCCPDNYSCAADGDQHHCVPPGATYCGDGEICPAATECIPGGGCMLLGSTVCGDGAVCTPIFECNPYGGCCPISKPKGCGSTCCPSQFDCLFDSPWELCLPPGAQYCGEGEWCPVSTYCPQYADQCVPENSMECIWGEICGPGEVCAAGAQMCCPASSPNACGTICCPEGSNCHFLSSGPVCLSPGQKVCAETEVICPLGAQCSWDGLACVYPGWDYCGPNLQCPPGSVCAPDGTSCGSVGSDYCPDGLWCPPGKKCFSGGGCLSQDLMDCGDGWYCSAGLFCYGTNQCISSGEVPCEGEFSCPPNLACGLDGESCVAWPTSSLCDVPVCSLEGYPVHGIGHCCTVHKGGMFQAFPSWVSDPGLQTKHVQENCLQLEPDNVSDRVAAGVYDALVDEPYDGSDTMNWITCGNNGNQILALESLWLLDNGENAYPDGPYSQIFADIYRIDPSGGMDGVISADEFWNIDWTTALGNDLKQIRGIHNGACPNLEIKPWGPVCNGNKPVDGWLDGDVLHYRQAGLYRWGTGQWNWEDDDETKSVIVLLVYEQSGPGDKDILGLEEIHRDLSTDSCGVWLPLRRFSDAPGNSNKKVPNGEISGYARLRTVDVGVPGSNPWNCQTAVPVETAVTVSLAEGTYGGPITFDVPYPWAEGQHLWIPSGSDGSILDDAASKGTPGDPLPDYDLSASLSTSPLGVHVHLEPDGWSAEDQWIAGGQALATLRFHVLEGTPMPSWFPVSSGTLETTSGPQTVALDVQIQNLCYHCATLWPGEDGGFRCPTGSGIPTACP